MDRLTRGRETTIRLILTGAVLTLGLLFNDFMREFFPGNRFRPHGYIFLVGGTLLMFLLMALDVSVWALIVLAAVAAGSALAARILRGRREATSPVPQETDIMPSGENSDSRSVSSTGEIKPRADTIQVLDDTQASLIFNKTSEAIIDIIHQTFQAYTTVFYLYNEFEEELILQSFRSHSKHFNASSRHPLNDGATALFSEAIRTREPILLGSGDDRLRKACYYEEPEEVNAMILVPLIQKGTLLGLLSVDHRSVRAFSERQRSLLEQYGDLIVNSIQTIDAVYLKNKLRRMFQSLREYSESVVLQSDEEKVLHSVRLMVHNNLSCDRYSLWLNLGNGEEARIFEATEDTEPAAGATVPTAGTLAGEVIENKKRLYIGDYPGFRQTHPDAFEELLPSVLVVPLIDQNYCFGVVRLESYDREAFNIYEIQFVESLCHAAALAMSRFRLDHHLTQELTYDPRTGIDNSTTFVKRLNEEIQRAQRFGTMFSLLICHIRQLRAIYERAGVHQGDFVLEKVAEIIKTSIRQIDTVARLSEDRFGVMLLEARRNETLECAQRMLRNCDLPELKLGADMDGSELHVGIAIYGADGDRAEALMESAEEALGKARKSSAPHVAFFS